MWLVRVNGFGFFMVTVVDAVGALVLIGVRGIVRVLGVGVVGSFVVMMFGIVVVFIRVVVVVAIHMGIMPVMIISGSEADLLLYLAEILACSHGVFQTQSRNLLNNRLHDKLHTLLHRISQGRGELFDEYSNFFVALFGHN